MTRALAVPVAALVMAAALPALGLELPLPTGSRPLSERISPYDSYGLPVGPFADGKLATERIEGRIERRSWQVPSQTLTTLQILDPLRSALINDGFTIEYQCEDRACGGFDFRFAIEVIPAPDMHVNIRDFRFLAATREGEEAVGLLVSRGRNAAYVQMIYAHRSQGAAPIAPLPGEPAQPAGQLEPGAQFLAKLTRDGHIMLGDLDFRSGSATLSPGRYVSLERIAAFMAETPDVIVALVGHTDSVGTLEKNIALSKRRAQSVRQRLIQAHGVDPARLEAEGMGYLAPIASNLVKQGRDANRRVEAVLLPAR